MSEVNTENIWNAKTLKLLRDRRGDDYTNSSEEVVNYCKCDSKTLCDFGGEGKCQNAIYSRLCYFFGQISIIISMTIPKQL